MPTTTIIARATKITRLLSGSGSIPLHSLSHFRIDSGTLLFGKKCPPVLPDFTPISFSRPLFQFPAQSSPLIQFDLTVQPNLAEHLLSHTFSCQALARRCSSSLSEI